MSTVRPFKLWSADRTVKKSVTASSFIDLMVKARQKFQLHDNEEIRFVLEDDGTEVDEEEYFTFLSPNTTFIILRQTDKWRPRGSEVKSMDEPDYCPSGTSQHSDSVTNMVRNLQRDLTKIVMLSTDNLQDIVNIDTPELATLLQETESYARSLQEACQRHLDDRHQTTEALDLLRLYHTARQHSPYIGEDSTTKKKKHAHT